MLVALVLLAAGVAAAVASAGASNPTRAGSDEFAPPPEGEPPPQNPGGFADPGNPTFWYPEVTAASGPGGIVGGASYVQVAIANAGDNADAQVVVEYREVARDLNGAGAQHWCRYYYVRVRVRKSGVTFKLLPYPAGMGLPVCETERYVGSVNGQETYEPIRPAPKSEIKCWRESGKVWLHVKGRFAKAPPDNWVHDSQCTINVTTNPLPTSTPLAKWLGW